jgi:hypothetical protein
MECPHVSSHYSGMAENGLIKNSAQGLFMISLLVSTKRTRQTHFFFFFFFFVWMGPGYRYTGKGTVPLMD